MSLRFLEISSLFLYFKHFVVTFCFCCTFLSNEAFLDLLDVFFSSPPTLKAKEGFGLPHLYDDFLCKVVHWPLLLFFMVLMPTGYWCWGSNQYLFQTPLNADRFVWSFGISIKRFNIVFNKRLPSRTNVKIKKLLPNEQGKTVTREYTLTATEDWKSFHYHLRGWI